MQERRLFADSKTFADAVPKSSAAAILALYTPGWDDDRLRAFVAAHFALPDAPSFVPPPRAATMAGQIAALWPELTRPATAGDGGSLLAFAAPHVVPGGRFRELYYWDSYFAMLGLAADGRHDLVAAMTDGFADLIERYGHVPNGTRSYYIGRSQPPLYHLMPPLAGGWTPRRKAALEAEYRFWTAGARAATMPDGAVLARYDGGSDAPRDESWAEDVATGRPLGRELRAGAESGWDFSSRWLADGRYLKTIRTTRIVPCDLNALLLGMEEALGLTAAAERRRTAMMRWLWHEDEGRFGDWDLDAATIVSGMTAAALVPLFSGAATQAQADRVALATEGLLLAPGGLRTTLAATGQQWDAPNGWAPLQWFAIAGLRRYGHQALAAEIARRWLATVKTAWQAGGLFYEKYDVESGGRGGGGEYEPQAGFGWTNGVTQAILNLYG